ncbi:hypothetical protein RJT34_11793 [Clitoria ternatea]|uniref:Uncharacterized protein n=1 Tax=Clitoria ternatea TaxID=43366 RepID=A0AAN9JKL3_CLITE
MVNEYVIFFRRFEGWLASEKLPDSGKGKKKMGFVLDPEEKMEQRLARNQTLTPTSVLKSYIRKKWNKETFKKPEIEIASLQQKLDILLSRCIGASKRD